MAAWVLSWPLALVWAAELHVLGAWNDYLVVQRVEVAGVIPLITCLQPMKEKS